MSSRVEVRDLDKKGIQTAQGGRELNMGSGIGDED